MKAVTIRNLPADLARAVRRKAHMERTSLNHAVISLAAAGAAATPVSAVRSPSTDFTQFAGTWSRARVARYRRVFRTTRRIDPDLWR